MILQDRLVKFYVDLEKIKQDIAFYEQLKEQKLKICNS